MTDFQSSSNLCTFSAESFSRISPAIEVDFSLTGKRVVEVLERLKSTCGLPKVIKVDNGVRIHLEGDG